LTGSLILTAIAAGIASLAFLSLLHSMRDLRSGFMSALLTNLAAFIAVISFILALVAFVTAHHRYSNHNLFSNGLAQNPHYGSAMWLHLVGTLLLLAACPFVFLGWLREGHDRRARTTTTTTTYRA